MVRHNVEQGSEEWFALRLAIPTASEFSKVITPTGKASTQMEGYANRLIAEWLTGLPGGMEPNGWMQRGTELEPEARASYELETDADVAQVGFITTDDGWIGCSPDSLVGDDGMLEIKCPSPAVHVGYLLSNRLPSDYIPQIQGQLLVAEREWCDFYSYHPDMPAVRIRVERDPKFIEALRARLHALITDIIENREKLTARGIQPIHVTDDLESHDTSHDPVAHTDYL